VHPGVDLHQALPRRGLPPRTVPSARGGRGPAHASVLSLSLSDSLSLYMSVGPCVSARGWHAGGGGTV
jgi:hypothetical protein